MRTTTERPTAIGALAAVQAFERARLVHRRCACGQRSVSVHHEVRATGETWRGRCAHCGAAPDVTAARARLDGHLARPRH